MAQTNSVSTEGLHGRATHWFFLQFPVVCFTLALLTDIAYWRTANLMWQNFSSWLLFAGLFFGALAVLFGILDLVLRRFPRGQGSGWLYGVGSLLVLVLAFINSFVHAGDGWTAVMPWGLTLSAVTVILMIVTSGLSHALRSGYGMGVRYHE